MIQTFQVVLLWNANKKKRSWLQVFILYYITTCYFMHATIICNFKYLNGIHSSISSNVETVNLRSYGSVEQSVLVNFHSNTTSEVSLRFIRPWFKIPITSAMSKVASSRLYLIGTLLLYLWIDLISRKLPNKWMKCFLNGEGRIELI